MQNRIGDEGAKAIAAALPRCVSCEMKCAKHHLMQETNSSFPHSVGFYLVSAPLKTLDLRVNGLDDAAKTLVRGAAKEGMSLQL